MAGTRTGELSASMVILGLLVEQPDTVAGVGVRLAQIFPHAQWSPNAAHGNVPSLEKQGFVRLVKRGPQPSLDRFEATPEGFLRLRQWVRTAIAMPPTLRDALQAKLEFVELDELRELIASVREAEDAYASEYAAAHGRVLGAKRPPRRGAARNPDWREKLRAIQMTDEMMLWALMAERTRRLGDELEELYEEATRSPREVESGDG
jgi:hypothetical protein